ncbi:MAG: hypothetical protein AAF620_20330 [Bacteroidota bacterium]
MRKYFALKLILLVVFFSISACRQSVKKEQNKKVNLVKEQVRQEIIYFYDDTATHDKQTLIIERVDQKNVSFDLITDTDLCKYTDKGKAKYENDTTLLVVDHPIIKAITFNSDKTIVSLICDYGDQRNECDPIQEFEMKRQ